MRIQLASAIEDRIGVTGAGLRSLCEPSNTNSKTSTPWLITLMHEHFHQLQNAEPEYNPAVNKLGLNRDENRGMWMLNYPFPHENAETGQSFSKLRDLLLNAINELNQSTRKY